LKADTRLDLVSADDIGSFPAAFETRLLQRHNIDIAGQSLTRVKWRRL